MKSFRQILILALAAVMMTLTGCDEQLPGGELTGATPDEVMCDGVGVDRVITYVDDANGNGCIDEVEVDVWRDYGVCNDGSWSWYDDDTDSWFETAPTSFWLVDIDENLCSDEPAGDDDDATGDDDDASGDDDDATGDDDDATSEPPLTGPVACPGGWAVYWTEFHLDSDENGCLTVAEALVWIDVAACNAGSDVDNSYWAFQQEIWIHEIPEAPFMAAVAANFCP